MNGPGQPVRFANRDDAARALFGDEKRFSRFIGAVLLLTLQFQTLPFNINVQMLPLTTALAVLFFPFIVRDIPRSPVLTAVGLFAGYAVVHSALALGVDLMANPGDVRFYAWTRQLLALLAGVITYLVLRSSLVHVGDRDLRRFVILGAVPALGLSMLNIMWGTLGQAWAGGIVTGVRAVVSPEGFTSPFRATGFATEPASLAASLVIVLLPLFLFELGARRRSPWMMLALLASVLAFSWTFSVTGVLLLLFVLLAGVFLGPNRRVLSFMIVSFIALSAIGFLLTPSNQIMRHAGVFAAGSTNVSFTDRYYSAVGPFLSLFRSWTSVGYGLGGVATHFGDLVPADVRIEILQAKYEGLPNLTSVFGRVLAETGIIGWALFLSIFVVSFRSLSSLLRDERSSESRRLYACIRLGLISVVLSIFFAIGPYHTPFLWLWIAVIDARWIVSRRDRRNGGAVALRDDSAEHPLHRAGTA